ncbi:ABC transporter ATP-binding protein [Fusobacterium sp.]|uniref:ABC transporter ATP-binding protein n=1 Tax=Fusobacterium sp. TaxID=68766 RepID=UPI00290065B2|nr:ABC transporter ATP-binding protein [Fusobacterium sp.]MDU1910144.1 ABC transporter ATP-binding protein [Fusobacterium sp.]
MIQIKNLSYMQNGKYILKNINITIKQNCVTGILGPNGSGKTTLLKHIIKELTSKNNIFIDGENIEKIPRKNFARKISFVEQSFTGIEEITIEDIVKMGRYPYKKAFFDYSSNDKLIIDETLYQFQLEDLKDKRAGKVSGGELKRAFIAKAFAQQSEIMLLDEPINHLDIKHQLDLMKLLKSMKNKTIIFSIHNIDLALKFCDDIILMKDGEITAYGKTQKVLTPETIKEIFEVETTIKNIENEDIIIYNK